MFCKSLKAKLLITFCTYSVRIICPSFVKHYTSSSNSHVTYCDMIFLRACNICFGLGKYFVLHILSYQSANKQIGALCTLTLLKPRVKFTSSVLYGLKGQTMDYFLYSLIICPSFVSISASFTRSHVIYCVIFKGDVTFSLGWANILSVIYLTI